MYAPVNELLSIQTSAAGEPPDRGTPVAVLFAHSNAVASVPAIPDEDAQRCQSNRLASVLGVRRRWDVKRWCEPTHHQHTSAVLPRLTRDSHRRTPSFIRGAVRQQPSRSSHEHCILASLGHTRE